MKPALMLVVIKVACSTCCTLESGMNHIFMWVRQTFSWCPFDSHALSSFMSFNSTFNIPFSILCQILQVLSLLHLQNSSIQVLWVSWRWTGLSPHVIKVQIQAINREIFLNRNFWVTRSCLYGHLLRTHPNVSFLASNCLINQWFLFNCWRSNWRWLALRRHGCNCCLLVGKLFDL